MTKIQILTVEYKEAFLRVMIEDINDGHFRRYDSIRYKDNASSSFTAFTESEQLYFSAADAFKYSLYDLNILSIENQMSGLLTVQDIETITGCKNIKNT